MQRTEEWEIIILYEPNVLQCLSNLIIFLFRHPCGCCGLDSRTAIACLGWENINFCDFMRSSDKAFWRRFRWRRFLYEQFYAGKVNVT